MYQHFKPWIGIGLFGFSCLIGQIASTTDTLEYNSNKKTFQLSHTFILDGSIKNIPYQQIHIDSVNNIEGLIYTSDSISGENKHVFSYSYLNKSLPKSVRNNVYPFKQKKIIPMERLIDKNEIHSHNYNNVQSAGSFFRQLNMTQKGGSEFSGGMKFQLQGNIYDNLQNKWFY